MDHYLDIHLRPDPEFTPPLLMSALFTKLHRGLVELKQDRIGISFPNHNPERPSLGQCLRLHGRQSDIESIMELDWLRGMQDHVHAMPMKPVPENARHRVVQRIQVKSNAERLRRRAVRSLGLSEAEAVKRIPDKVERQTTLPFVSIQSGSTGQRFRVFILHGDLQSNPTLGHFSSYGLSHDATVPWF